MTENTPLYESDIRSLPLIHRGKVRDIYAIDDERMLIVTTDRLSAFDVVLPDPIPGKGHVLTAVSNFWFRRTKSMIENHLLDIPPAAVLPDASERNTIAGRAVVVKRVRPVPIEAIARGYLIGSGWKDYQKTGTLCGLALPPGFRLAEKLPEPIFTPSTKATVGQHDENVTFPAMEQLIGEELAARIRETTLRLYTEAAAYALSRGIIIADTKFEFGLDSKGELLLIDEALTPDSSRFWPANRYKPGISPPSFDKQYIRDYLETLDWNKRAPGPRLPLDVIAQTSARYREARKRLIGD